MCWPSPGYSRSNLENLMTTKRTPLKRRVNRRISEEAIAAWKAGDWSRLHDALDLLPCEMSPLPSSMTAYGCPETPPAEPITIMDGSWQQAKDLQAELMAIAGPPGRLSLLRSLLNLWSRAQGFCLHGRGPLLRGGWFSQTLAVRRSTLRLFAVNLASTTLLHVFAVGISAVAGAP
jgi:hypothetical protein